MSSVTCGRFTYESESIINVCQKFSTLLRRRPNLWLKQRCRHWMKIGSNSPVPMKRSVCLKMESSVKTSKKRLDLNVKCAGIYTSKLKLKWSILLSVKGLLLKMNKGEIIRIISQLMNVPCEAQDFSVNVPSCNAPDFHGSYEEWPSFRDMFTAVYISKVRMPYVQKLLYLRRKAKGEASSIVNKFPLTNDAFL